MLLVLPTNFTHTCTTFYSLIQLEIHLIDVIKLPIVRTLVHKARRAVCKACVNISQPLTLEELVRALATTSLPFRAVYHSPPGNVTLTDFCMKKNAANV